MKPIVLPAILRNILLFLATFVMPAVPATAISQAEAIEAAKNGNQHFSEQKYKEAIDDYKKALTFGESAQLYHNLGQAHASQQQYGWALTYFLKAKQLEPLWTHNNTALAQLHQESLALAKNKTPWHHALYKTLTECTWQWIAMGTFWLFVWLCIVYCVKCKWRVIVVGFSSCFCIFAACTLLILANRPYRNICMLPEKTIGHFAPSQQSPTRYTWPMGTLCWIKSEQPDFYFVTTTQGEDGWVQKNQLIPMN
jgi:tetratricopeptide (TPR) repeat protein